LTIEKPAAGGRMIARHDGRVLLVSGAIPGERVTARVNRIAKGVAYASVDRIVEPSPDRRDEASDPLCGGCLYSHIDYPRQLAIKGDVVADAFARIGRLPLAAPVDVSGSPRDDGYRMRARLHVAGGKIGFFREGTHELCDARQTKQLLDESSDVLDRLSSLLQKHRLDTVSDVELSENADASARVVHLGATPELPPSRQTALSRLEGVTGLSVSSRSAADRAALVIAGDPYVTDRIECGPARIVLRRHVLSFFQANRYLLRPLVERVAALVPSGSRVIDLYAGTGLFAIAVAASRNSRVIAVEGDRSSASDLDANARLLGGTVEVVHQSVEIFANRERQAPDVLIVDPPRTGMSREALEGAIRLAGPAVVYVSCDVATLARDARRLVDAGYAIRQVRGFDLFPNTPHVETVALFERGA